MVKLESLEYKYTSKCTYNVFHKFVTVPSSTSIIKPSFVQRSLAYLSEDFTGCMEEKHLKTETGL